MNKNCYVCRGFTILGAGSLCENPSQFSRDPDKEACSAYHKDNRVVESSREGWEYFKGKRCVVRDDSGTTWECVPTAMTEEGIYVARTDGLWGLTLLPFGIDIELQVI